MSRGVKIILILLLVIGLVLVRTYAATLFYDPLINFFKGNYISEVIPDLNFSKLLISTSLRFWINTSISLAILWVLFGKKDIIKLSLVLYSIAFIVLLLLFYLILGVFENPSHMLLFYVRRFLIQPIFLLLLIPAFYFQRKAK